MTNKLFTLEILPHIFSLLEDDIPKEFQYLIVAKFLFHPTLWAYTSFEFQYTLILKCRDYILEEIYLFKAYIPIDFLVSTLKRNFYIEQKIPQFDNIVFYFY